MVLKVKDFDLEQTLECGQCFNFEKTGEHDYIVLAFQRMLHVTQSGDMLDFHEASEEEVRTIWIPYFDLERDYGEIKTKIGQADSRLLPILKEYYGIRILSQEFPETLISFIISQNKNIPQIKKIVRAICEGFGDFAGEYGGKKYYSFPKLSRLKEMTEEDFRNLKTGFRAPYIMNAIRFLDGLSDETLLRGDSFENARRKLMTIKGVGEKVANCVLLFSLGFKGAFPVDVWIKRVMEELYFEGQDTPKQRIEAFAEERFGALGGFAQQYLFMYIKNRDKTE